MQAPHSSSLGIITYTNTRGYLISFFIAQGHGTAMPNMRCCKEESDTIVEPLHSNLAQWARSNGHQVATTAVGLESNVIIPVQRDEWELTFSIHDREKKKSTQGLLSVPDIYKLINMPQCSQFKPPAKVVEPQAKFCAVASAIFPGQNCPSKTGLQFAPVFSLFPIRQ